MWEYFDSRKQGWIYVKESDYLEATYKEYLRGSDVHGRVFHSFGNGASCGIDFVNMRTFTLSKNYNVVGATGGDGMFPLRRT